ncbi:ferrochelatase [Rickettsiales bacterium]|jgi:protoporphyrin/coproporphyrin ferrochelatase|nr:ferrochelatase [Rickettsiales bacterium]|tara:strand:+ start:2042 stop:3067 length:1026 start_codon:yes stop_codon:yes gene_type:complete
MSSSYIPQNHPKIKDNLGVLLINLGTPDNYDFFSVRRYLKEFLSDQRVIEVNPILWKFILNFIILNIRPFTSKKNYKKIWFHNINESPLSYYTRSQSRKTQEMIDESFDNIVIDHAMRYGNPSIESKINKLLDKGCRKILFIPLYPQYCAATTATSCDEIYRVMKKIRWQPDIRIINQYCDNEYYIKGLVGILKKHFSEIDFKPEAVLGSYHGIPQEYFDKGDPYSCFCHKTHRLFSQELEKQEIDLKTYFGFQSRFGPKEWLQPYTSDILKQIIDDGIKNLAVITPGFSCDCVETLEEVAIEYKEEFLSLGGKNFTVIPCLNDENYGINLIFNLIKSNAW